MSDKTKVVVAECVEGKYGPQIKDVAGVYYSFGKFYKGDTAFPAGTVLEIDLYTSPKGNRYVNQVLAALGEVKKTPTKTTKLTKAEEAPSKPMVAKSETMTKADWGAKDRSQLIGGLSHDAATVVAALLNVSAVDDVLGKYKELLEGMLKIREELK